MPGSIKKKLTLAIFIGIAMIFALSQFKKNKEIPKQSTKNSPVTALKIKTKTASTYIPLIGTSEAIHLSTLKSALSTDVLATYVKEGELVAKDTLLLKLDCRKIESELKSIEAKAKHIEHALAIQINEMQNAKEALIHDKALLKLIERDIGRQRQLFKRQLGSEAKLDEAIQKQHQQLLQIRQRKLGIKNSKQRQKQFRFELKQNAEKIKQTKIDIEHCEPKAPFNSIILKRFISQGDQVQRDQTLLTLFDKNIRIRAQLPHRYLNVILNAKKRLAYDDNQNAYTFKDLNHDSRSGSHELLLYPVKALKNPILGLVGHYYLVLAPMENCIVIPHYAIHRDNIVYRINHDHLEAINIKLLGPFWDGVHKNIVVIRSHDLKDNDKLLLTPLPNARSGLKVSVQNEQVDLFETKGTCCQSDH